LADFDAFVMGTAIYAGMWMGDMVKLMRENEEMLGRKPIWFFASGPTGEGDPETLLDGDFIPPNVRPLLDAINPNEIVLFHGKVDFKELAWAERLILRAIGTPTGDFRDMESIQSWAAKVANELVPRAEG
jgi:menaquinone-dependent protoporphyrinogen oxidase